MAEQLSQIILNHYKNMQKTSFRVPIDSIDGVMCIAFINISNNHIYFTIKSDEVRYVDGNGIEIYRYIMRYENELSIDLLSAFSEKIIDVLKNGKLSLYGNIETDDQIDNERITFQNIFVNIPNITFTATQECCVCINHTLTKTPCNHILCHRCWFKLRNNSEQEIPCPMCRQDIGYIDMEN
jgi:hypothetical protein